MNHAGTLIVIAAPNHNRRSPTGPQGFLRSKTQNSKHPKNPYSMLISGGWGARIRTWEWRNQNPLPYHLATPQQVPESRTEQSSHAAAGP